MKQITLILLISLTLFGCLSKNQNQNIDLKYKSYKPMEKSSFDSLSSELLDTLNRITMYEGMPFDKEYGRANSNETYSVYYPYQYLIKNVDTNTLIDLTDYPHPLVRLYAFSALIERDSTKVFDIITKHFMDTCLVENHYADMYSYNFVVDLMIYKGITKLNDVEKDSLIDIIFFDYTFLNSYYYILPNLDPDEKYYKQIRKNAIRYFDEFSIIALSKYKKKQDIPIIKIGFITNTFTKHNWHIGWLFKAISNFPDKAFLNIVLDYPEFIFRKTNSIDTEFNYFYPALAKYKSKKSVSVFEECINPKHYEKRKNGYWDDNKARVLVAIEENYDTVYFELRERLRKEVSETNLNYAKRSMDYETHSSWM